MVPQTPQQLNIDVSKYIAQKETGTVRIIKVNGVAQYAMRRFDPDEGTPVPMLVALSLESAQEERQRLLDLVAQLDEVIKDITAAEEV